MQIEFRDVNDGDMIPIDGHPETTYWPRVLQWFCPSLSAEDAMEIYRMGRDRMIAANVATLRRLILDWAATKSDDAPARCAETVAHRDWGTLQCVKTAGHATPCYFGE